MKDVARSTAKRGRSLSKKGTDENRRAMAEECWKNADLSIGEIVPGYRKFLVTRGQFGTIDIIIHILRYVRPANVSIWNWGVGKYDINCLENLMQQGSILSARLFVDIAAKRKDHEIMKYWIERFGEDSLRYIINHSKMTRIWNNDFHVLSRGSGNLNFNPRFEQFDIGEGEDAFYLVERLEQEILELPAAVDGAGAHKSSQLGRAAAMEAAPKFGVDRSMREMQLNIFGGVEKTWGGKK